MEADKLIIHNTSQGIFLICNKNESIQSALLNNGEFEHMASKLAIVFGATKAGVIIDIGANIGVFTVPVATNFRHKRVLSIEPQKMVFMHLCANVLLNRLTNVDPIRIAIADPNLIGMNINIPVFDIFVENYTGSVSLDKNVQRTRGSIQGIAEPSKWAKHYEDISVQSLNSLAVDTEISFIKIDVEGMELAVLKTGETVLKDQLPFLYFESWTLKEFEYLRFELLGYINSLGYVIVGIGEDCFAFHPNIISLSEVIVKLSSIGLVITNL